MIFKTIQHYDTHEIHVLIENEEDKTMNMCFICYNIEIDDELKAAKLDIVLQENYIKTCTCNGWIHKKCLHEWYNISKKCPICRENIEKKKHCCQTIVENKNCSIIVLLIKNRNNICRFIKLVIIMYAIIDIYLLIIRNKKIIYHYYEENF